jgi:hypothetical protein
LENIFTKLTDTYFLPDGSHGFEWKIEISGRDGVEKGESGIVKIYGSMSIQMRLNFKLGLELIGGEKRDNQDPSLPTKIRFCS